MSSPPRQNLVCGSRRSGVKAVTVTVKSDTQVTALVPTVALGAVAISDYDARGIG